MRWLLLCVLAVMPFIFCSCKTGVTDQGEPCYALDAEEIDELVALARVSLRKPHRQLSADDIRFISTSKPDIIIKYTGDCSGEFKVRWNLPDKRAGVRFSGLLNDPRRRVTIFEIIPNNDRVVYKGVPGKKDTAQ